MVGTCVAEGACMAAGVRGGRHVCVVGGGVRGWESCMAGEGGGHAWQGTHLAGDTATRSLPHGGMTDPPRDRDAPWTETS